MTDKKKHIQYLLYVGLVIPILLHFTLSGLGGSLIALAALLLFLISSYRIIRHTLDVDVSSLFFLVVGVLLTLISLCGFVLAFIGFKLMPINFFIASGIVFTLTYFLTENKHPKKLTLDYKKLAVVMGIFLLAFTVYLYPSLPYFRSPCTYGFDCNLHIDYARNIYATGQLLPPIWEWRYYPSGFHTTTAFLTHALEPNAPAFTNFLYPYAAFLSALLIGMLGLLLYDKVRLIYLSVFTLLILTSTYPASDLIQYGFYGSIMGNYYCILFVLIMAYYIKQDTQQSRLLVLFTLIGSLLAYQILTTLFLILLFTITTFTIRGRFKKKTRNYLTVLLAFGLFFSLYTGYGYARSLTYETSPADTGIFLIMVDDMNMTNIRLEKTYAPHEKLLPLILSGGIDYARFKEYVEIGSSNLNGLAGSIIFHNIRYYGYFTLMLFIVGFIHLVRTDSKLFPFMLASIVYITLFIILENAELISVYYSTKIMHYFLYPLLVGAVVGLEYVLSSINSKKLLTAFILILMVLYCCGMLREEWFNLLLGDRSALYTEKYSWPLMEFNRFQRCQDMFTGVKRENYGLKGWLEEMEEGKDE